MRLHNGRREGPLKRGGENKMASNKASMVRLTEFNERSELNRQLGLDVRDNIIMSMLQKNSDVSQLKIAKKVKLSQPSVGARIRKLQEKGIIQNVTGVNFNKVNLYLGKIDVNTTDTSAIISEFGDCPFFLNGLVMSGQYNLCLLFMATGLRRLEGIVNHHLRSNPKVKDIQLNIVISTARDFVLPLSIDYDNKKQMECQQHCRDCI